MVAPYFNDSFDYTYTVYSSTNATSSIPPFDLSAYVTKIDNSKEIAELKGRIKEILKKVEGKIILDLDELKNDPIVRMFNILSNVVCFFTKSGRICIMYYNVDCKLFELLDIVPSFYDKSEFIDPWYRNVYYKLHLITNEDVGEIKYISDRLANLINFWRIK